MSLSPTLPIILAACWIFPALIITVLHQVHGAGNEEESDNMNTSHRGIRAEVLQVDYEPSREAWRDESWGGPGAGVRHSVTDASYEVMVLVPFAEANVRVANEENETELRKCSLCLN